MFPTFIDNPTTVPRRHEHFHFSTLINAITPFGLRANGVICSEHLKGNVTKQNWSTIMTCQTEVALSLENGNYGNSIVDMGAINLLTLNKRILVAM